MKLLKKIRSKQGETIPETLAAMLIVSLAFVILAGGIVTAARVNNKSDKQNIEFLVENPRPENIDIKVVIDRNGSTSIVPDEHIHGYRTGKMNGDQADYKDGYCYYEYEKK